MTSSTTGYEREETEVADHLGDLRHAREQRGEKVERGITERAAAEVEERR
jgi:hypothetical protein